MNLFNLRPNKEKGVLNVCVCVLLLLKSNVCVLLKVAIPVAAEAIEVQLKNCAYVVKRTAPDVEKPTGCQVTWSKFNGPVNAWKEACQRAGIL